jgi:hypothetical protein
MLKLVRSESNHQCQIWSYSGQSDFDFHKIKALCRNFQRGETAQGSLKRLKASRDWYLARLSREQRLLINESSNSSICAIAIWRKDLEKLSRKLCRSSLFLREGC